MRNAAVTALCIVAGYVCDVLQEYARLYWHTLFAAALGITGAFFLFFNLS